MFAHRPRGSGPHVQLPEFFLQGHAVHHLVDVSLDRPTRLLVELRSIGDAVALEHNGGKRPPLKNRPGTYSRYQRPRSSSGYRNLLRAISGNGFFHLTQGFLVQTAELLEPLSVQQTSGPK